MEGWPENYKCEGQMDFSEYLRKETQANGRTDDDGRRDCSKLSPCGINLGEKIKNQDSV
jgi:hypothetical protein